MKKMHTYRILREHGNVLESVGDEITTNSDKQAEAIFHIISEQQSLPAKGKLTLLKQIHKKNLSEPQ